MITLLLATRNPHKVEEIRAVLGDVFRCLSLDDFSPAPIVVEDAGSFAGNATKKAVQLARWISGLPGEVASSVEFVLADDSGLEVDALNGAPGVHSARFAAMDSGRSGNSADLENNAKLLKLLAAVPASGRRARFRCVIALTPAIRGRTESASPVCYADEFELATRIFEGVCEGRIQFAASGQGGFGYDPLFLPEGFTQSFAELGEATKNQLSHRARALAKLKSALAS